MWAMQEMQRAQQVQQRPRWPWQIASIALLVAGRLGSCLDYRIPSILFRSIKVIFFHLPIIFISLNVEMRIVGVFVIRRTGGIIASTTSRFLLRHKTFAK